MIDLIANNLPIFAEAATQAVETVTQVAGVTGDIGKGLTAALGCSAAAIGVAMIGTKADGRYSLVGALARRKMWFV